MTNNSDGKLTERLRAQSRRFPVQGGGSIGTDANGKTVLTSYVTDDGKRLINPDGPAAAALIEQQQTKITALVEALEAAKLVIDHASAQLWNGRPDAIRDRPAAIDAALRQVIVAISLTSSEGGEA